MHFVAPTPTASPARSIARGLTTAALAVGLGLIPLATATTSASAAGPSAKPEAGAAASATAQLAKTRAAASTHTTARPAGSGSMGWRERSTGTAQAPSAAASPQARTAATSRATAQTGILGIDVASYQGNVNWTSYRSQGKSFAYVKATEGTSYKNPYFGSQYTGAYKAGLYHGAYHFATPNKVAGSAIAQADFFASHGGGWSRDGRTLPGVLDIEYNPYGATCYGLSRTQMVTWVKNFTTEYKRRTTRDAVIYSTTDWWSQCTGNSSAFSSTNPLWIARYSSSAGTLPHNWGYYTFWQYSATGIDQDKFNGTAARLRALALG